MILLKRPDIEKIKPGICNNIYRLWYGFVAVRNVQTY